MDWEDQIAQRYEPKLAAIAKLDRAYYLNPSPTVAERAEYALRQEQLERLRLRLYAELSFLDERRRLRRCRCLIRSAVVRRPRR
jgi:uncharacterized protein YaeQ